MYTIVKFVVDALLGNESEPALFGSLLLSLGTRITSYLDTVKTTL